MGDVAEIAWTLARAVFGDYVLFVLALLPILLVFNVAWAVARRCGWTSDAPAPASADEGTP